MSIYDLLEKIKTKKDFELFLGQLRIDLEKNKDEWENVTLKDFLEAMHAYTIDLEGFYKNMGIPFDSDNPDWKVFAQILTGAKVYE